MHLDSPAARSTELPLTTFDDLLGRRVIETHIWAVHEGLRGASADELFDRFCQRLVVYGLPLWRAHASMETLHPQWSGYGYTWRNDLNAIEPESYAHHAFDAARWIESPFSDLIRRARSGERNPCMRRRLEQGPDQRDFPVLTEFFNAGATDYVGQLFEFGQDGDRSQGTGIVYSFACDRRGGFGEDETALLQATLPALSLAIKAHAGQVIASGLLGTYLGADAGRRVHAGAVERGSVEAIRAVLWYADIRGFTRITDVAPGPVVVDMLNDVFETITSPLRSRGGQVLKFMGDGMLATFPFAETDCADTCRRALDAAAQSMRDLDALNTARAASGLPIASVDFALHLGEVLYGNVGATDRLDFTVIGPAVNEVSRIEALCEPLGCALLMSADLVASANYEGRLRSLGHHTLRGVSQAKEIFSL